mmetsp:Transcript_3167/g.9053  ORF Transcript_3167/g.9053 Transcript_3167/m.9053 type:complete len:234 (-) Transcript_3167:669-1370(-)
MQTADWSSASCAAATARSWPRAISRLELFSSATRSCWVKLSSCARSSACLRPDSAARLALTLWSSASRTSHEALWRATRAAAAATSSSSRWRASFSLARRSAARASAAWRAAARSASCRASSSTISRWRPSSRTLASCWLRASRVRCRASSPRAPAWHETTQAAIFSSRIARQYASTPAARNSLVLPKAKEDSEMPNALSTTAHVRRSPSLVGSEALPPGSGGGSEEAGRIAR